MDFTVLMSVYYKEKPDYLIEALTSVFNQSNKPTQVVLIADGPLNYKLDEVINEFETREPSFEVYRMPTNQGLQFALNYGLQKCRFDLIARMDTDDVCAYNRFELQLECFKKNTNLALVGSNVDEFIDSSDRITSVKQMPKTKEEIIKFSRLRNPFNHPSVMFRKEVIDSLDGYRNMPLFEDYDLWLRVIATDFDCININISLTKMRTVDDLYLRRGGIDYVKKSNRFRYVNFKEGHINLSSFLIASITQGFVGIMPNSFRRFLYLNILRRKNSY